MIILADVLADLFSMPTIIFVVLGVVAIVSVVFGTIAGAASKISVARAREQSRREIAAYVAEGTIDPEKAVQLLKAGLPVGGKDEE